MVKIDNKNIQAKYCNFQFLIANFFLPCVQMLSVASASAPQAVFSTTSPQKPLCRFSLTWVDFSSDPKSLKDQTCHLLRNTFGFSFTGTKCDMKLLGDKSIPLWQPFPSSKDGAKVGQLLSFPHFSGTEQRCEGFVFYTNVSANREGNEYKFNVLLV